MKTNIDKSLWVNPNFPYPDHPDIPNPIPLTIGTHYTMQKEGVVLPTHEHPADQTHCTMVLSGSFKVTIGELERTVSAGDLIDLGTEPHSFTCIEPGSFLNIAKPSPVKADALAGVRQQLADAQAAILEIHNKLDDSETVAAQQAGLYQAQFAPQETGLWSRIKAATAALKG
jgi:hypothetical protein